MNIKMLSQYFFISLQVPLYQYRLPSLNTLLLLSLEAQANNHGKHIFELMNLPQSFLSIFRTIKTGKVTHFEMNDFKIVF